MDPEEGDCAWPFSKFYFESSFTVRSTITVSSHIGEVSTADQSMSTRLELRSCNLGSTGIVLGGLCILALLPSCVMYTLERSLVVLNRRSGDHPQRWTLQFVRSES